MVHIHVLRDYGYLVKVRDYAEKCEIALDWWTDQNVNILAISGTLNEILQVQAFIDGMYAI